MPVSVRLSLAVLLSSGLACTGTGVEVAFDGGSACPDGSTDCSGCGDGKVSGSEKCDGESLNSTTCVSLGFAGGTLSCSATCAFDTSACTPSGVDAGSSDAGTSDAGTSDAGTSDSGTSDAGAARPDAGGLPDASSCLALDAGFAAEQELRFSLPIPYEGAVAGLSYFLSTYERDYLASQAAATTRSSTCPTDPGSIVYFNYSKNWIALGYLARAFYDGQIITAGDCNHPQLSGHLRDALLKVADHVVANANADTEGIEATDPNGPGLLTPTLGWTNLASSWDAWCNDAISPPGRPNLWASSWAMNTIALAYKVSNDPKYLRAFILGALYWHAASASTAFNAATYANHARSVSIFDQYPPWKVKRLYTVGGTRFATSDAGQDAIIRYHYLSDDPALFALNDHALLALDMVLMGPLTNRTLNIADPTNPSPSAYVARTFENLGRAAMTEVAGNFEIENDGYASIDCARFDPAYNTHFDFTAYYLAQAGVLLHDSRFVAAARALLLKNRAKLTPHYGACLNRTLDQDLFKLCEESLDGGAYRTSFYYLFPAIVQLDH